uniref:Sulfatase N-terminal domain-containing protein n=2 Tax=Magallana gigas TaxID=29159 RepID=A0A8W8JT11_MAGGI|nr:arylsulfatase B-like [Crassostrea gigas]
MVIKFVVLVLLGGLLALLQRKQVEAKSPHILFIVADDLGWNDVGFHNPAMKTPNIDKLAREGLILNQTYLQPLCSPSRHALMTGYYPYHAGLQHLVILPWQPVCSPLKMKFLPQRLKDIGYATHMVGKWHLGFCSWNCTPTYRGFDSFFGYYNAQGDHYSHTWYNYLDYRDNEKPVKNLNGTYSTFTFVSRAQDIIKKHNSSQPLFLYMAFQNVHDPIQVPKQYEDMYPNIKTQGRRQFSGMVSALDEAIGNITDQLRESGMYDDTLIVFTSDNGGWPKYYGNNYPLRGGKFTVYEGGTRVVSFVHGAGLQKTGESYESIMHAVDWSDTLVEAAGGKPDLMGDGVSQWSSIANNFPGPRTELVYNFDSDLAPEEGHAAIRVGDYKLIDGYPSLYPDWYKPDQLYTFKPEPSIPEMQAHAGRYQLFNLKDDPTEHNDLSKSRPDIVTEMSERLRLLTQNAVPPNYPLVPDPKSNPSKFDDVWSPGWC